MYDTRRLTTALPTTLPAPTALLLAATVLSTLGGALEAHAACNLIPGTSNSFLGAQAAVDRPFAVPGEWVEVSVASQCYAGSTGFVGPADDYAITLVFTPPNGSSNVVVLATDCSGLGADLTTCQNQAGVDTATCVTVSDDDPPVELEILDTRRLRFRFPNTDGVLAPDSDGLADLLRDDVRDGDQEHGEAAQGEGPVRRPPILYELTRRSASRPAPAPSARRGARRTPRRPSAERGA